MYSKRLRDVPLFHSLGKRDIEAIAQLADEVDAEDGRVLAKEGDIGHEFFVIEAGTAQVTREGEALAELGPGDFFGEIALVQKERRTATVTATSPMTLIVLSAHAFRSLKLTMPGVYAKVEEEIVKRRSMAA